MEYVCKNCGGTKVYALPKNNRMGVYCSKCNAWITWTTYEGMKEILRNIKEEDLNENVAMRKIKKYNRIITVKCGNCDCLLHDSSHPKSDGQFDLLNAVYCPNCGKMLI